MPDGTVLYEPRGPQLWQPGCAALGVAIGIAAIATGQLGGIVLVVLFGLFLAVSVMWYRQRPDRLTIDEAGFTVSHGALTSRCLWSEVESATVVRGKGRPWVHIQFRSDSQATYPWRKALPGSSRRTAATLPANYGMDLDELAALLERRRRQALASESDAPDTPTDGPEEALPAGYIIHTIDDIGVEIIRPGVTLSCFTLFVGVWTVLWDIATISVIAAAGRDGFDAGEVVLLALTAAVGAAFTVVGLRALLIRRSWVVTDGVVDERSTFKGIGEIRHRRHLDVARIEMRTGLWETGAGRTDDLVLWTRGSSSPLELHPNVENTPGPLRALGHLFARHTRRPFTTVEQRIPEPKPPDSD